MNSRFLLLLCALLARNALAEPVGTQSRSAFVIGNSITQHLPAPNVGWNGAWGMAASDESRDYVSRLMALLEGGGRVRWHAARFDGGGLERSPSTFRLADRSVGVAVQADLVVVELGDNYKLASGGGADFDSAYAALVGKIRPTKGVLVCVSTWWKSAEKDKIIRKDCEGAGGLFVDISKISTVPENVASSERSFGNKGVGAHPGDRGMSEIANAIFNAVTRARN